MTLPLVKQIIDRIRTLEGVDFATRYGVLAADYTLTSSTLVQKAFGWSVNGALNLPTGMYHFQSVLYLTGMDTTAGSNAAFSLRASGTATLSRILFQTSGKDAVTATTAAALSGAICLVQGGPAASVNGAVNGQLDVAINGVFDVTGAGTIIPSITLAVAAAAVVKTGSFFRCTRIGATGVAFGGTWT